MLKSLTGTLADANETKAPPLALKVGATVSEFVPAVGVRTTVTVACAFVATVPIKQETFELVGFWQVPPGDAVAEENVNPDDGSAPLKITLLAGSGPLFTKAKVNVTWFPTVPGFGLTVGESVAYANVLLLPTVVTNASWVPWIPDWNGAALRGKFPD